MNATTISELTRKDGWAPLRRTLGTRAFGLNAWTKNAGEELVGEHAEERSGQDELYVVVSGRATFTVDGEERDASAGTLVLVPPASRRAATAVDDGTTVLVVGAREDGGYRPRSFETNGIVIELFGEGKIEEARDLLLAVPEGEYEDPETIAYNLACCEAKLGNAERAFDYLRVGLEGRADLVDLARNDDDLATLRDDPRFDELLATPG
jgi:mannose-6-phosphate isomerase-like protein (cupin superfamily)